MRRKQEIPFNHFKAFTFGSDEELITTFGSLESAQRVWHSISEEFLARWDLWGRPEAWWRFEPGIPDHLRSGPPIILSESDAKTWRQLESERAQYLMRLGIDPHAPSHHQPSGSD